MSLEVISLADLLSEISEERTQKILDSFETIPDFKTGDTHDVEKFLKKNAIQFQKMGLAATHLVFSSYQGKNVLVGFISIANKHLTLRYRTFNGLSKSAKNRYKKIGYRTQSSDGKRNKNDLIIPSFLIGQIGKNHSEEARKTKAINGYNLLAIAEGKIEEAVSTISGKYIWLECLPHDKLMKFYESSGYTLAVSHDNRESNLCVYIKKIS